MKIPTLIAIGLIVGILAGIWTSVSMVTHLVTFAAFFAWSSYFASGGGLKGLKVTLICNFVGVIYGFLMIQVSLIISPLVGDVVGLGIAIGVLAMFMCWQAKIPLLGFIPGVFIGCATYFATGLDFMGSVMGLVIGALLGHASQIGGTLLTKREPLPDSQKETAAVIETK
jgi:hypothetical protein